MNAISFRDLRPRAVGECNLRTSKTSSFPFITKFMHSSLISQKRDIVLSILEISKTAKIMSKIPTF